MNGAINLPITLDDSATRDELANLRLQASNIVAALNANANLVADAKALLAGLVLSLSTLSGEVRADVQDIRQQLVQIATDLESLRDLVPDRKPTFLLSLAVRNKEQI